MIHTLTINQGGPNPEDRYSQSMTAFLYERRKEIIWKARRVFPGEPDIEKAYWRYCRETGHKYIPMELVHNYASLRQREWDRQIFKLTCESCGEKEVTMDRICPSCEEYANGNRTSLYCSHCLKTTFTTKFPEEILSERGRS